MFLFKPKTNAQRSQDKRQLSKTSLSRPDDGLGAVGNLQFAEDARNIIAHRLHADDQGLRNLGITPSLVR